MKINIPSSMRSGVLTIGLAWAATAGWAIDAGLDETFQNPAAFSGTTRNITTYGATAGNSSNDDATAINAAITASAAGDIVYIPDGTFHIKSKITMKNNVALRGQSRDGAKIYTKLTSGNTAIKINSGAHDIELSGFTLRYDTNNQMSYGVDMGTDGGSTISKVLISNVRVKYPEKRGIVVREGKWVKIQNCIIHEATSFDGGGYGYGVDLSYDSENCWLTGNTFYTLRHGVIIQFNANHNLIENNTAYDCVYDCFDLHGESEYSNELRFNTARDSVRAGFGVGNTGSTHEASGPSNWLHDKTGVEIIRGSDDQFIEDNDISDCTAYGVRVYDGGANYLDIYDNTILNCVRGIYLDNADNAYLNANVLDNNGTYALYVESTCQTYTITNNSWGGDTVTREAGSTGTYSGNTP